MPLRLYTSLLASVLLLCVARAVHVPHFSYIGVSASRAPASRAPRAVPPPRPPTPRVWGLQNVTRLRDATDEATIAFFVQVSEASLPLVARLLARLHHPANFYALHFDRKIPAWRVVRAVAAVKAEAAYGNVHVMERESVTYRGITMVLNNMAAISELMRLGDWDYFINLSGSDYPLVAPSVQRRILAMPHVRERASNFFIVSPREQWEEAKRFRFQRVAVDPALGMGGGGGEAELVILDQQSPLYSRLNYDYVKGEGWLILTRDACRFMLESAYARKMLLSMATSQEASEHYYVSLFWNHPEYNRTIVPHSLRTVYWKLNGKSSGQHPYVIDKMVEEDGRYSLWPWLRLSPHWFARKFSTPDSPIMDLVDNEISGLGDNVNQTAVDLSLERMEHHLHWLFGILPKEQHEAESKRSDDKWPTR